MNIEKRITKNKLTSEKMNIEKRKTNQLLFALEADIAHWCCNTEVSELPVSYAVCF